MFTILAPLDGTPQAEVAFMGIQAFAGGEPARVRFLYVGDDPEGAQQAYLDRQAAQFAALGHETSAQVQPGDPADVICATAHALPADLVVMKRDEREGLTQWVLGSITDKVARELRTPLLLMNPQPGDERWHDYRLRHLLVPLDGSEAAEQAIDFALGLAERLGARVTVLYSVPFLEIAYTAAPEMIALGSISPRTDAQLEADMIAYLEGVAERYAERIQLGHVAMRGKAGDAIATAAASHDVDLVVLTSRGAGSLVHPGLGSVAEDVTSRSSVPVLLIRPETV